MAKPELLPNETAAASPGDPNEVEGGPRAPLLRRFEKTDLSLSPNLDANLDEPSGAQGVERTVHPATPDGISKPRP
ncbi:MAG: hypothetical protein AAFU79_35435, partial [Myxococcota bacterium]